MASASRSSLHFPLGLSERFKRASSMPTKTIDVQKAQADLRSLIAQVTTGTEIVLTDGTTPVARIVRADGSPKSRTVGLHPGAMRTSDDFDEPLPEDFWTGSV